MVSNDDATTGVRVTHQMLFNTDQVIEVFVIGVGGVGGALLEQIKRQQGWLKNKTYRSARLRCSQFSGAADQRAWPESGKLECGTGGGERAV
ncbi:bifunctional aspartokinase I/homoserine dehydrogenase I [Klebsiella pneumoniae]|uniref:Bifunctional aspartokinase I/homoserine dehydrogenase I n=1 Tax=Klebsiella pneumoniae TaxID=573 RepID=A0A377WD09_KLEPN|nr:bifunctional aspartokinase I/homoserine dehydrogenase I [Klebsiella pneumoniae]